jgi:ATP-dependent RNA/DNA helicase IGHMBP2
MNDSRAEQSATMSTTVDFLEHLDHWIEYLTELLDLAGQKPDAEISVPKIKRQMRYLLAFRKGANCNLRHNLLLQRYFDPDGGQNEFEGSPSECRGRGEFIPIQSLYKANDPTFDLITSALVEEDLFFLQGPPGTGKTTAIVEIILQTIKANPKSRILVCSETHVAVDNAMDRLAGRCSKEILHSMMRYPQFAIAEFECPHAAVTCAFDRAEVLWQKAYREAPMLTQELWSALEKGSALGEKREMARWQARNLAEVHRVIGVTCNQVDHLIDEESEMFDLVIVDECSKATMPEWLMAMSVARKCILVGDHKQLPPTFCSEESEILDKLEEHKERLIRNGVIERLFRHLPTRMKGTLKQQFRMLKHIGAFVSENFYNGELLHFRNNTDHSFSEFGWLSYDSGGYRVPASYTEKLKFLKNEVEIEIIFRRLFEICKKLREDNVTRRLSVALITPYRAQCRALRERCLRHDFSGYITIEVDTVDAFQGREADIVFFSFVRNTGSAKFYADDRRINVAISRARDAVYLIGDIGYIRSRNLPILSALSKLPQLRSFKARDFLAI